MLPRDLGLGLKATGDCADDEFLGQGNERGLVKFTRLRRNSLRDQDEFNLYEIRAKKLG